MKTKWLSADLRDVTLEFTMAAPPDNENESRIAFGPFEFHRDAQDLRKHGTRIRPRGQPLRILDMLLREPGEIARREDLQKQIGRASCRERV